MCTFEHNPNLRKPRKDKIVVYKAFDRCKKEYRTVPVSFAAATAFKFGWNRWDGGRASIDKNEQSGFQVFPNKKDAEKYVKQQGWLSDLICPVTIFTKDIIKITNDFDERGVRVFEVNAWAIWKKDWNAERKKNWDAGEVRE